MLIGYDEISASTYEIHSKKKQLYFDQLLELARSVIEVKDERQFIKNPRRYIIDQAKNKTGLLNINEEQFLKLVDLPLAKINLLFDQYNNFSCDLFAPAPSFEIHTTNKEQETEYKALLKLCKELNEYKRPLPLQLQFQFNGDILLKDNKWIPNYNKIKSI